MKGGQRADFAPAGVIRKPAAARARDAVLDAKQRLHRRSAETDQKVRISELDLPANEGQANGGFLRGRRAIAGRPPRHDIGDVRSCPVETDGGDHAVEQLAGPSDEWAAGNIFIVTRRLAYEHDAALRIAVGKNQLRRR